MLRSLKKAVFPLITLFLAVLWFCNGVFKFGFWDSTKGPLGGFFPSLIAVLLFIASLFALLQVKRTLLLYLLFWLRIMEKYPWRTTLTVTLILSAIVYGVFVVWLAVPFPKGVVFDRFF